MASSILSDMELDEGIAMPVSNAENKKLEDELLQMQKEVSEYSNDLTNNNDRVLSMTQHFKNVQQELYYNQGLLNAHRNEIETEEHLCAIAEREDGRLCQEVIKHENELSMIRDKRNNFENKIFMQRQQLEELKSRMNWDQQALEAWLEESARRDEDIITLQKYSNHDNSKLKELSLGIEHLTDEVQKKRRCLDRETTETLTAQIELDKTAEEFRKAHADRQALIAQWEITIEQMQRRDREMDQAALELAKVKEEVRMRDQVIKEKLSFMDSEMQNNEELEKKIGQEERLAAKLRIDLQGHENMRTQLQDELDTLKYTVERTASDLEGLKSNVTSLRKDVLDKQEKLRQASILREEMQMKLEAAGKGALSAEEMAQMAAAAFADEEESVKILHQEIEKLRIVQFRKKQDLFKINTSEKNTAAELQGSRAANRNLSSWLKKLDQQSIKQQEIIYNQDFTIQQLEQRLARMQGDINTDEKQRLEAKIRELTETLERRKTVQTILASQLKSMQDDIRRLKRDMDTTGAVQSVLITKIEELNLHNEISDKKLKTTIARKQDGMVEENIMKLDIRRMQDALHKRADEVLTLEKRLLQLSTAMKERKQEVKVHKDMLFSQLKAAEEERQTVSSELHQRKEKIDKLRKRYEILMVSMAPPEGEEDRSQAYYVIKAAQEKEELQRSGDELDARIRKAEKEIRALENTLRLMNSRNETYRKSFNKVTESSEEYELKTQLDEQLRSVMDKYKYKRRQIRELQEDLQTMSSAMDTSLRDETAYLEIVQDKKMKIQQFQKELEEQKEKLERVQKQLSRSAREARTAKGSKVPLMEEQDMDLRDLRDKNKKIAKSIAQAVHQFPDLTSSVHMYYQQANLPVPSVSFESRSSSKSGSVRSSARSSPRSSISSARSTTSVKAVDLGLGLQVTSPPGSRPPSSAGSRTSVRSVQSRSLRK